MEPMKKMLIPEEENNCIEWEQVTLRSGLSLW